MTNLAGEPRYAELQAELIRQMEDELRAEGDPRILGNGEIFDGYPYANRAEQGFYEKYPRRSG